jgi:hypothetical protein
MLHLVTICAGDAVPRRNFDAQVHSVFSSAANLRPAKSSRLLSLLTAAQPDLPQGLRLNTPPGFSFESLRIGEIVTCRDGLLHFEHSLLTIDLRPAVRWNCDLPALAAHMQDPPVLAAWQSVAQILDARQARSAAGLPAGQLAASSRMDAGINGLVSATRRCDLAATGQVAGLIGLGPGLTPSGDDFLVGYLAGLWCAAGISQPRVEFLSALGKAVVRLSRRTNDISRTYLYHAAHGQVSSHLASLARAICRAARSNLLQAAAEAALQVGHESGAQSVRGLLLGLSAWDGHPSI